MEVFEILVLKYQAILKITVDLFTIKSQGSTDCRLRSQIAGLNIRQSKAFTEFHIYPPPNVESI